MRGPTNLAPNQFEWSGSIGPLYGLYRGCGKIWQNNWVSPSPFLLQIRKNGTGHQLHRNIKIHGGLVILNFHFPKNRKVFIFMISGLMEITGNPWKPSVCCRGCPQGFFLPKRTYSLRRFWRLLGPQKTFEKWKPRKREKTTKTNEFASGSLPNFRVRGNMPAHLWREYQTYI